MAKEKMSDCNKCGLGNNTKGVKVSLVKIGKHNWSFERFYCDCEDGKKLQLDAIKGI
tara:strand:- start:150 stop:320 length:171 start_codon:yes stop_codon:yes gene_type:complete